MTSWLWVERCVVWVQVSSTLPTGPSAMPLAGTTNRSQDTPRCAQAAPACLSELASRGRLGCHPCLFSRPPPRPPIVKTHRVTLPCRGPKAQAPMG